MKVTLKDTGEVVRLSGSKALTSDITSWEERYSCNHDQKEWRRFPTANGNFQTRAQCLDCGHVLGGARKREPGDAGLALVDHTIEERHEKIKRAAHQDILQRHARLQRDHETAWTREHNEYLKSPEWLAKRQLVLRRAGQVCEGCGIRAATQVHHRSYDHWQEEFLFELLAVCVECHDRLHIPEIADGAEAADEHGYEDWSEGPCIGCRFADGDNDVCGLTGEPSKEELAEDGNCGPTRRQYQELK